MVDTLVAIIDIQYKISSCVQIYFLSQSPNEYFVIPATKIGIIISFGKLDLFGIIKNNIVINIVNTIVLITLFIIYNNIIIYISEI